MYEKGAFVPTGRRTLSSRSRACNKDKFFQRVARVRKESKRAQANFEKTKRVWVSSDLPPIPRISYANNPQLFGGATD